MAKKNNFSVSDLDFILYNNRSITGVVKNFLFEKEWDGQHLSKIDYLLSKYKRKWKGWGQIEIDTKELNLEANDIEVQPAQLRALKDHILESHKELVNNPHRYNERRWLYNRGFNDTLIAHWKLGSLQYLIDSLADEELDVLGVTCHPILENMLNTTISGGGIVIPFFNQSNELENCTVRRISDTGKLKYTQAVPDLTVYGIQYCNDAEEIYIAEGIFDMMALIKEGKFAISVSSAMWSSPQISQLLSLKANNIIIFADNDRVGLSSAAVLKSVIEKTSDKTVTIIYSEHAKDASEHFLKKHYNWASIHEINVTKHLVKSKEEVKFNLVEYLKNRTFSS